MTWKIQVIPISQRDVNSWILVRHYAKRKCPVSYAFGAYDQSNLCGIITYGTPSSSPLRDGICGPEYANNVLELNRLCCLNEKNLASTLIGRSLKLLPRPSIVVSYADMSIGHVGYVYQACNFIYTGLSAKRTDWKIRGMEHLHGSTVADKSRGNENRAEWMREKYGDSFYLLDRPRKHRYVYFVGTKKQRASMLSALRYPVEPYPKGDSKRYDTSTSIETQTILHLH